MLVACVWTGLGGCAAGRAAPSTESARGGVANGEVTSNVLRSDYVGSRACEACHQDIYRAWDKSPMHRMTRIAEAAEVRAPFDGSSFRFKDDSVKLVQDGNERFVVIASQPFGNHVYRVTRVIGGRYREDFAGVEVSEPRVGAMILKDPKNELVLPVTFVYSPPAFRLKGYSVMVASVRASRLVESGTRRASSVTTPSLTSPASWATFSVHRLRATKARSSIACSLKAGAVA